MPEQLHVLTGLPRSGSTLLANVLNQHPDVHVSSTSALARVAEAFTTVVTSADEVKSDLIAVPGSYDRTRTSMRRMLEGWYEHREERIVIDKSREWAPQRLMLEQVIPGSQMIVTVRDPRHVVASIERVHRRTAVFNSNLGRTLLESVNTLMIPAGMVGGPMRIIEDLIRRDVENVIYVQYESLVRNPIAEISRVFDALGIDEFTPDVDNVEDHASDVDGLYNGKYPHHDAIGKIKPTGTKWTDVLPDELAALVAAEYPLYMQTFGYTRKKNRAERRGEDA